LSAAKVIDFYTRGLQFQPPGLLPISYDSHYQVSIELANEESPSLIETTVSNVEWRVIAASLPSSIDVVGQLVESGEIDDWPNFYVLQQGQLGWEATVQGYQARRIAIAAVSADLLNQSDWTHSPFAKGEWFARDEGPSYWGPFPQP
jgi:hypothetical protein